MDYALDIPPAPKWYIDLENRIQCKQKKLGHEIGAGAKCFNCTDRCPGLDLHFWRKTCKKCKCSKEEHDVLENDDLRFEILFKDKENSSKYLAAKSVLKVKVRNPVTPKGVLEPNETIKPVNFDWVPPAVSQSLAADYMSQLPSDKTPISGSGGAIYRKLQMKKQIPMHDLMPKKKHEFTTEEQVGFFNYLQNLRESAGIGKILRVKQMQYIENSEPYDTQSAQSNGIVKPIVQAIPELNTGFQNINIHSQSYNRSPVAFSTERVVRPRPLYAEATPGATMHSLPPIIPSSVLRLPSSFLSPSRFENQVMKCNMNTNQPMKESPNNNQDINKGTTDSLNTSVINTVPTVDNERSTITPLKEIGLTRSIVPSIESEERMADNENTRPISPFQTINCYKENALDSDSQNANNITDTACALAQTSSEIHQAESKLQCVECKEIIEFNTVAVFCDKPYPNSAWHPKCFVCKECKELLVDLMHFFHKGFVYCARHYTEKLKIHRCFACDELIFVKEYTLAEGHFYHNNHFCCVDCDIELAGRQYLLNDFNKNLPTCLECYETNYAEKCQGCGQIIKAEQQGISFKTAKWHAAPECFKCTFCHVSLIGGKFLEKNLKPFCSKKCYTSMLEGL